MTDLFLGGIGRGSAFLALILFLSAPVVACAQVAAVQHGHGRCTLPPPLPGTVASTTLCGDCDTNNLAEIERLFPVLCSPSGGNDSTAGRWRGILRVTGAMGREVVWLALVEDDKGKLDGELVFASRQLPGRTGGAHSYRAHYRWQANCYGPGEFDLREARKLFPWLERRAPALAPGPGGLFLDAPQIVVLSSTQTGLLYFSADEVDCGGTSTYVFGQLCELVAREGAQEPLCEELFGPDWAKDLATRAFIAGE